MRRTLVAISAFAAVLAIASFGGRTEAAPLGAPGGLSGAVDDVAVVDSVHCRPGWPHHAPSRWRRANGCERGGVVVVPGGRWSWRNGVRVRIGGGGDRDHGRNMRSGDRRGGGGDGGMRSDDRRGGNSGGMRSGGGQGGRDAAPAAGGGGAAGGEGGGQKK